MARTKPTRAREKILAVERNRLRQRMLDPDFQRDLKDLESIAKRLAQAPSGQIPVSKLSEMTEADLLPTPDEEAFHLAAERFKEKWGFRPRWNDDGKADLFISSPVRMKLSLKTGEVIETTKKSQDHLFADLDALEKWYRLQISKRGRSRKRRLRPLDDLQAKIRSLRQSGLTNQEILNRLDPPAKARWTPRTDPRYRDFYAKHARHDLDRARRSAERELRKLHRAEEAKSRKIRDQLRYLIRQTSSVK